MHIHVQGTRMSDGVRGRVPSNCVRPLTPANTNTSYSASAPHESAPSSSPGTHTDVTRGQTSANVGLAALFGQEVGSAGSIEGPPLLFGDEGADTVLDRWLGFGVLRPFSQCCNSLTILNRVPAVTGYHLSLAGLCVSSLHGNTPHAVMLQPCDFPRMVSSHIPPLLHVSFPYARLGACLISLGLVWYAFT